MTKSRDKLLLDFTGTDPEAKGPINWALDEAEGRYFRKWLAPTLRCLAATPERAAEIDSNEGVLDVIEVKFPPKGSLITPHFGRPTGMRFFLMLRSLGAFAACLSKATAGAMPADHETIRIWGLSGGKTQDDFFLFREVLGGGGPGGLGPTAPTSCTSCRIRAICPPNSRRRAIRFWSSNWASSRIPAAPASAAAASATTSASARWSKPASSPTPIVPCSAVMASMAARPDNPTRSQ